MVSGATRVVAVLSTFAVALGLGPVAPPSAAADVGEERVALAAGWGQRELRDGGGWLRDNGGIDEDVTATLDLAEALHHVGREPDAVATVVANLRRDGRDQLLEQRPASGGSARTWDSSKTVATRLFLARVSPGSSVVDGVDLDRYLPAMVDPRNGQLRDVRSSGAPFAGGRSPESPDSQAELVGALRAAGATASARRAEAFLALQQCPDGSLRIRSADARCTTSAGARPARAIDVTAKTVLALRGAPLTDPTKRLAARAKDYLRRAQDRFGPSVFAGVVAQAVGGRHARTAAQFLRDHQLVRETGPDCPQAEVNRGLVDLDGALGDSCLGLERDDIEAWHDQHIGAIPVLAL